MKEKTDKSLYIIIIIIILYSDLSFDFFLLYYGKYTYIQFFYFFFIELSLQY